MTRKHGPWTIKSSEEKHRDPFVAVCLDEVIRPDGKSGQYATVNMKPGAAVLPIDGEGNVFITRQFRYALGRDSVEAVCGGIDEGETPLAAARREAREEIGVEASEWLDIGLVDLDTSIVNCAVNLFLARGLTFVEPESEGTETIEMIKVTFAEAVSMVLDGRVTHGPSCVLILKANAILRSSWADATDR